MTAVLGVGSQVAQASDCTARVQAPYGFWNSGWNRWGVASDGGASGWANPGSCNGNVVSVRSKAQLQWYQVSNGTWVTITESMQGWIYDYVANGWYAIRVLYNPVQYPCGYTPSRDNGTWRIRWITQTQIDNTVTPWRDYVLLSSPVTIQVDKAIWCGP